ncbi:MAG TPA: threonine--tRNA ligase [Vicinamibacterales bacterium]|nr:threonine--tRNA ligase [Vicinamibacterales bacterium]
MNQVTVTLPDGSTKQVEAGAPVKAVAEAISPRLAEAAVVAYVDDRLVDLTYPLTHDAAVRIVTNKHPEALEVYRHSTAHLLAAAVTALFPKVQCGIGPPIDDGFFYDFVVERPFVPEDLAAIEAKMKELAAQDFIYERQLWPRDEAIEFFRKRGEPLKVQLIEEKTAGQREVSVYTIKDKDTFVDFCVGPHVPSTGRLKAFKLTTTSNAYWKGDAKNAPMQRVYGTAFFSQKELDEHLNRIEEAKKRDHRKLGRELDLFQIHPVAPGAAFWTPRGTTLYNTLVAFCQSRQKADFQEIKTPLLYSKTLWEQSGHWGKYRENMFLVLNNETNEHDMSLKPMNCPSHHLYYGTTRRSYRELPLRYVTFDPLHRNELSGALSGLTRVRQFSQDDCHVYLREDQIAGEVKFLMEFILGHYEAFGLKSGIKFATRPETRIGDDAMWDRAEAALKSALEATGMPYTVNEGDGAFYGPKIDFEVTDSLGRPWQLGTIQLDYAAPERFDLTYVGEDNAEHRPVVIHRAVSGSLERFIAILIEHYAGAFPLWLAPLQVIVLPIADRHLDYARSVVTALDEAGLRAELDDRQEKVNYKIREAQLQKIPYMLVVGDREAAEQAVAVRSRAKGDLGARPLDQFLTDALAEVRAKALS